MATGRVAVCLLQLWTMFLNVATDFPDLAMVTESGESLGLELDPFLKSATNIEELAAKYQERYDSGDMVLTELDGPAMASTMASQLGQLLEKKMAALHKSVESAERLAANYTWNEDLQIGDVPYINAKDDNLTTFESFEYSEQFGQDVNLNVSSVHIPVEIYEGDIEILNGLAWTQGLETVWKENREENPDLLWQFFGSQSGIMRNFPASRWLDDGVDLYDVRRRPWYTQGASSPKDMLILVDTSGSTHGQALSLMKQSVKSLLDTLGENDFVNVAQFSEEASIVGCFETFVQANYRHKMFADITRRTELCFKQFVPANYRYKMAINEFVDGLTAKGMASYTAGFEFAFEKFNEFYENSEYWEGAHCNPIIMFLTDGGTEMPDEVFQQYNWPDKQKRIFSYAVGPTAGPTEAAEEIACMNRGYFARIPSMGAIRSTVQEHVAVVARPLALSGEAYIQWSNVYQDEFAVPGLGMMTTVTLPVYNRTGGDPPYDQKILGVMGIDVTTREMENFIPSRELGPTGYAFAINNNGYIVFHPALKAQNGWLADPPNVDFLDVEYENDAKELLRREMIDNASGSVLINTFVISQDEMHVDDANLRYSYVGIPSSNFSLAFAIPSYTTHYLSGVPVMTMEEGVALLRNNDSAVLIAPCFLLSALPSEASSASDGDVMASPSEENSTTAETSTEEPTAAAPEEPEDFGNVEIGDCAAARNEEVDVVQQLFFHAEVTADMLPLWQVPHLTLEGAIEARFVASSAGITRVYPHSAGEEFEPISDPWTAQYYSRALNNDDKWMFSAKYNDGSLREEIDMEEVFWGGSLDANSSLPTILAAKVVSISNYRPAVIGLRLNQAGLRSMLIHHSPSCNATNQQCYLLDDSGYIIVSSDPDQSYNVGEFLGTVDQALMSHIRFNNTAFESVEEYDFQASCVVQTNIVSAGFRSIPFIPNLFDVFFDMLSLQWWTTKFYWAVLNLNFYNWLTAGPSDFVLADVTTENISCIKKLTQYYPSAAPDQKESIICETCNRAFATALVQNTNMMLVVTTTDTCGNCDGIIQLDSAPVRTSDPLFADGNCRVLSRYRTKPAECYDYDENEDDSDCGGGSRIGPSVMLALATSLIVLMSTRRIC